MALILDAESGYLTIRGPDTCKTEMGNPIQLGLRPATTKTSFHTRDSLALKALPQLCLKLCCAYRNLCVYEVAFQLHFWSLWQRASSIQAREGSTRSRTAATFRKVQCSLLSYLRHIHIRMPELHECLASLNYSRHL